MTLTLTFISPAVIHQTADHRLVNADTDKPFDGSSPKQVVFHSTPEGSLGVITYDGIGAYGGIETSAWLDETLSASRPESANEAGQLIAAEATKWLGTHLARYPHTFTVAGFDHDAAFFALVSNCQQIDEATRVVTKKGALTPLTMSAAIPQGIFIALGAARFTYRRTRAARRAYFSSLGGAGPTGITIVAATPPGYIPVPPSNPNDDE
jgi:hypothetical protein